jgi:hypothetical protein
VDLDDDTARAIEQHRHEHGLGLSEAVNELIRQGMLPRARVSPFRQRTRKLSITADVSNVAEALETLEGPKAR